jgi:hypothetical protein
MMSMDFGIFDENFIIFLISRASKTKLAEKKDQKKEMILLVRRLYGCN